MQLHYKQAAPAFIAAQVASAHAPAELLVDAVAPPPLEQPRQLWVFYGVQILRFRQQLLPPAVPSDIAPLRRWARTASPCWRRSC